MSPSGPRHQDYLAAVLEELEYRAPSFEGKELVSIYFGGGTPSLWRSDCLARVVERCCERFAARPEELELSLEANPVDCQEEHFRSWQALGVNRLLVGVQATNERDLQVLGRDHRMGEGYQALERSLAAGFRSVGSDVILGVPGSRDPLRSLREVAELGPPHLSAYELTIEERAPFGAMVERGELTPESEEELARLYELSHEHLTALGYEHYEVSSYAQPGHRARHNSLYWSCESYLALGNGAASLLVRPDGSGRRWQNLRSVGRYMGAPVAEREEFADELEASELAVEALWLAMRTVDGAPEAHFEGREGQVQELVDRGLVLRESGRIRPSLRGFLFNNELIRRLALPPLD